MSQFGYPNPITVPQRAAARPNAGAAVKTIPFDYVFQFALQGSPTNKVQDVVEISAEGVFVALSVGYSLALDERRTPRRFGPALSEGAILEAVPDNRPLADVTLGEVAAGLEKIGADLTRGFRLNPDAANLFASGLPLSSIAQGSLDQVFELGSVAAEEVSFLYSIDAGATGREYQNKAIHNIAGLGIANGDRPFRPFAKPIMFEPRSFIRIQIEEISGPPGALFIVLQGYKMLGAGRIPV
jgi:hypothetical protein